MTLLETRSLSKHFGKLQAVNKIDYKIPEGNVSSVIGPNGAGKTTFFNLLSGKLPPTDGEIIFDGENITKTDPEERVNKGMARVFQISNLFPELTVLEHIRLCIQSITLQKKSDLLKNSYENQSIIKRSEDILKRIELSHSAHKEVQTLSHGEKRRVELGMALALDPKIILLDEPTGGLPQEEVHEIITFLEEIAREHTLLLVEHKMDVVMTLSDNITVFHHGEILADGPPDEIVNNERVREVYLGDE
jgi:branched-chain amino acid transport system ATP-binding protein